MSCLLCLHSSVSKIIDLHRVLSWLSLSFSFISFIVFEVTLMCECKGTHEEEWGSGEECPVGYGLFVHQTESHSALENFQSHQQGSKRLLFFFSLNHQYT